jgi:DNA topoisomerase VI subunit A
MQELTTRDQALATNLCATLQHVAPEWVEELRAMLASGSKAEIEALDGAAGGDLAGLLADLLQRGDCV